MEPPKEGVQVGWVSTAWIQAPLIRRPLLNIMDSRTTLRMESRLLI